MAQKWILILSMLSFLNAQPISKSIGSESQLNQAPEDMKIRFFKNSFEMVDTNKDGFITDDEFEKYGMVNSVQKFKSLVSGAMTEALMLFEQKKNQNLVKKEKLGISFEDYTEVLKRKLQRIYD